MSGERAVILVGTTHKYQYPGSPAEREFQVCLQHLCSHWAIAAIAEEMNVEALKQKEVDSSIARQLARSWDIRHRYCDPVSAERELLRIISEQQIRLDGFFQNLSNDEIERAVVASHSIRERYWLEELGKLNAWPVVFICGANHIERFSVLLQANGISVTIAFRDWEPRQKAKKGLRSVYGD